MTLRIGDVLGDEDGGFCGGMFGRDSHELKRVEYIGADWVVARNLDSQTPVFAHCRPEDLEEHRTWP